MTGPEHYSRAVRILEQIDNDVRREGGPNLTNGDVMLLTATAQVHAMLALAAASVTPSLSKQWAELIG